MAQPLSTVDSTYSLTADARPSNYLVNHVSWGVINEATNWVKTVVVRKTSGFPITPDDGERIFSEVTDSLMFSVSAVTAGTGAISGVTLQYYPTNTYSSSSSFVDVAGVTVNKSDGATPTSPGAGATFTITTNSSGVPSISITNGGSGYSANDIIRISGTNLGARIPRAELGVLNKYHIYDTGSSTAVSGTGKSGAADANPGYGVTGSYAKGSTAKNPPNKYYYSIFVQCDKSTFTSSTVSDEFASAGYTGYTRYWRKLADVSCPVILDKGTLANMLGHLPSFYTKTESGSYNNDLKQFLSLFAFHLDIYLNANSSVFNASNINKVDEVLLKEWLTQLGGIPEDVISIDQLRKLVKTVVKTYTSNGSVSGIKNLIETYGGYNVVVDPPVNIIPNFDSSTFLNSTGNWYGDPTYPGSFSASGTFLSNVFLYSNKYGAFDSYADYLADPAYNEIANPYYDTKFILKMAAGYSRPYNITNATATATTITYTAGATGLVSVGDVVAIDNVASGSTALPYYNVRGTVTATSGSTFTIANYNGSVTAPFAWATGTSGTFAEAAKGITLKVNSTANLRQGDKLRTDSSSGSLTFAENTVITAIVDSTTIRINKLPVSGYASDNDVVRASTNLNSNVMRLTTDSATATQVSVTLGVKRVKTSASATATAVVPVKPGGIAQTKDFVIDPINNSIPRGTYVSSINSSNSQLVLRDKNGNLSSVTLTSGAELWFSNQYQDKTGAITQAIGVDSNKPYSFGIFVNPSTTTAHTSAVSIMWYDKNASYLGTSAATTLVPASIPASTWTQIQVSALSPTTAMYAMPRLDIMGTVSSDSAYVDAAQFTGYVNVTSRSASGTVATLYTDKPHNFKTGNSVTVIGVSTSGGIAYDGTFAITAVSQNYTLNTYSFSYNLSSSSESQTSVTGYASSIPINFEDSALARIKIRPNRINLLLNPYLSSTSGSSTADTTRWNFDGCSSVVENQLQGVTGGTIQISARYTSARKIPVTAGLPYSWSGYFKDYNSSATMQAGIVWYSAAGAVIGSGSGSLGTAVATVTTGYVRPSVTAFAPAGAAYAIPKFTSVGVVNSGNYLYAERFLFESSYNVGTYFDGDFDGYTKGTNKDTMWEGSARSTRSYLYNNYIKASGLIDKLSTDGMYYA